MKTSGLINEYDDIVSGAAALRTHTHTHRNLGHSAAAHCDLELFHIQWDTLCALQKHPDTLYFGNVLGP